MMRMMYFVLTLTLAFTSVRADINTDIGQFMQGRKAAPSIAQDYVPVQSYVRQPDGSMKKTVEMLPSPRYGNGGIDMYTAPNNNKNTTPSVRAPIIKAPNQGVALFVQGYPTGASL